MQSCATNLYMNMQENELRRLMQAYTDGNATSEEKELLEKFFNSYRKEAEEDFSGREDLTLLEKEIKSNIDHRILPVKRLGAVQWWSIAASLTALVVAVYFFLANRSAEEAKPVIATITQLQKNTGKGQKLTIKLPDGSMVKMNSLSTLSFPENFNGSTREVVLQGEAYFQVTHNPSKPFIVRTSNASTTVLGTSFNVSTKQKEKTQVTLVEGKVNVAGAMVGEAIHLKPNQQAIIMEKKIDTLSVDVSQFIEWKDDILAFHKTPMREVVKELEDWYGVDIELKNNSLNKCRITARYEDESLENVMKSFEFMLKGNFTLEGKKVTLSAKGCNGHQ